MYYKDPAEEAYIRSRSANTEKGDPFPHGKKSEYPLTEDEKKLRAKNYRKYGIGSGISMMGNFASSKSRIRKKKFGKDGWKK